MRGGELKEGIEGGKIKGGDVFGGKMEVKYRIVNKCEVGGGVEVLESVLIGEG